MQCSVPPKMSWESKVPPPQSYPPISKALLRDYENPLVSLNKALLGPYFLGGVALGGPLDCHENVNVWVAWQAQQELGERMTDEDSRF